MDTNGGVAEATTPAVETSAEVVATGPSENTLDTTLYPASEFGEEPYAYDDPGEDSPGTGTEEDDNEGIGMGTMTVMLGAMRVERSSTSKVRRGDENPRIHQDATNKVAHFSALDTMPPSRTMKAAWLYDSRIRRSSAQGDQPVRQQEQMRTLCAEVDVNGVKAYTLFDTGCTTDAMTPELAYLAKASRVDLTEPVNLQLGTKGSRTTIHYGARPRIKIGPVNDIVYFDVIDVDRYDLILGTTFCRQHNVVLDFAKNKIWVDGIAVPAYTAVQDEEIAASRRQSRQERLSTHLWAASTKRP